MQQNVHKSGRHAQAQLVPQACAVCVCVCVCACVCLRACVGAHASVRLCMQMLVCKRVYSCGAGTNNSSLLKMRGRRQCNCGRRIKAIEAANEGAEIVFAIACETSC